jgi:hypothetical protein
MIKVRNTRMYMPRYKLLTKLAKNRTDVDIKRHSLVRKFGPWWTLINYIIY